MILSVHQPQYLPWLGYFDKIDKSDIFVFLDNVQYKSREFQNRNKIRTPDGWLWLTVPVKTVSRQKISRVDIDNSFDWSKKHWNSLQTWYGKADFFKNYAGFFKKTYQTNWKTLIDLNLHIVNHILSELKIKTRIYRESELNIQATRTDRIIQICKAFEAEVYLSGSGGKDYLQEDKFSDAKIELRYQEFVHPVYKQHNVKINNFLPCMSILDLMFNQGLESLEILRKVNPRIL